MRQKAPADFHQTPNNLKQHTADLFRWVVLLCVLFIWPQPPSAQNPQRQSYLAHIAAANASFRLNEPAEAQRWIAGAPEEHRGWEWYYLHQLTDASIETYPVDGEKPTNLALSLDDRAVLPLPNGHIRLCSATDFTEIRTLTGHRAAVYAAALNPYGWHLYSCSRDSTLRAWDPATGQESWQVRTDGYGFAALAVHPLGKQVAYASWYREKDRGVVGIISLHNAADGKLLWKTDFGKKPILGLKFSPDGSRVAAGNWDGEVGIWRLDDLAAAPLVVDYADRRDYTAIDDVDFSPDGKYLVSATKCGEPRVWETETGKRVLELRGHRQAVMAVLFSPDGKFIFTAGDEGVLHTWDAATGELLAKQFGHSGRITRICPTSNGSAIITLADDRSLRRWNAATGLEFSNPAGRDKSVYAFCLTSDGKTLAMGAPGGQIALWDVATNRLSRLVKGFDDPLNALAFSPDGSRFVGCNWGKDVYIWDARTGDVALRLEGHEGGSSGCAYSPDGRWVAAASRKSTVFVWDAQTGALAHKLECPGGSYTVAFTIDGKQLFAAGSDGKLREWNTSNFEKTREWQAHKESVYTLAFSPDGKSVLSAGEDKVARIWNLADGKLLHEMTSHSQRIWAVAWSPDGSRIATGSGDLNTCLWDAYTGERVLTLPTTIAVYNLLFSPDGKQLLGNQMSGKVWVWKGK